MSVACVGPEALLMSLASAVVEGFGVCGVAAEGHFDV